MSKNKTILIIRGGVLQNITTTDKDSEFILIDWDNIPEEGIDLDFNDRSFEPEIVSKEKMQEIVSEIESEIEKEKAKSK